MRTGLALVALIGSTLLAAPITGTQPAAADPTPLDCTGTTESPEPIIGDGLGPGDANTDATPLTYGCYSGELKDEQDVDGFTILGTPVRVSVHVRDDHGDCAHVTWFQGDPPSNAISRWLCGHDAYAVSWNGLDPMRVQMWHGPERTVDGATPYRIGVLPGQ